MSYCTKAQLITEFTENELIELTNRDGTGTIDDSVLNAAIARADAEIDSRLRVKGWALPLTNASPDLTAIALDITRFCLYKNAVTDTVKDSFKYAIKRLDDYVKGLVELDIGSPNTGTTVNGSADDIGFSRTIDDRVFTATTLSDF